MAKKRTAKKTAKRGNVFPLLILFGLFLTALAVTLILQIQRTYDLTIGSVSAETILAPQDVVDQNATEIARSAAKENINDVYTIDNDLVKELLNGAESCFTAIETFRTEAQETRENSLIETIPGELAVDDRSWQVVIPQADLMESLAELPITITEPAAGYALLSATDSDIEKLHDTVMTELDTVLPAGLLESDVQKTKQDAVRALKTGTLSTYLKSIGELIYDAYIQPTCTIDEEATAADRTAAAQSVDSITLLKGSVLVSKGETITAETYQTLLSLGLIKGKANNAGYVIGLILIVAGLFLVFSVYLALRQKEIISSKRDLTLLGLLMLIALLLNLACSLIDVRVSCQTLAVILIAILLNRRTAESVNILFSLLIGLTAGGRGSNIFSTESIIAVLDTLIAGEACILCLCSFRARRFSSVTAGIVGALSGGAAAAVCGLILSDDVQTLLIRVAAAAFPVMAMSLICAAVQTMIENVFDIASPARLHELCSVDHPLLKRLRREAPGTYQHSIQAAKIAEDAARKIGADSDLARCGALFHDVGKLRRPDYFRENQSGDNIHDSMEPIESAQIIASHPMDADSYLLRYKIPMAVRAIAEEHHGTYIMGYFYEKALKEREQLQSLRKRAPEVYEDDYRYPGPKPSTKEAAIVMMAESCEAAARDYQPADMESIRELCSRLIEERLHDGQFDDTPLTLKDMTKVKESVIGSLADIYLSKENKA